MTVMTALMLAITLHQRCSRLLCHLRVFTGTTQMLQPLAQHRLPITPLPAQTAIDSSMPAGQVWWVCWQAI